jgi:hypothetical protein
MNIELEEVVVQDVSDDALELAAGGAQGGVIKSVMTVQFTGYCNPTHPVKCRRLKF